MGDVICACECGHQLRVSEFAVGASEQCPKCGAVLAITEHNTTPIEDACVSPSAPERRIENRPASTANRKDMTAEEQTAPTQCNRCGRAFRGDWDQHQTAIGLLCHICFNMAETQDRLRALAAEETGAGGAEALSSLALDAQPEPGRPPENEADSDLRQRAEWERRKQAAAAIAGVAIIVVTIFLVFTTDPLPERSSTDPTQALERATEADYPAALAWFAFALRPLLRFAAFHIALYMALRFSSFFVTAGILQDQIPLIFKSFGVWLFWAGIGWFVLQFPLIGPALWLLCFVISLIMIYLIVDMNIGDILTFCVLWIMFSLLAPIIGTLVLGPLVLLFGP